MTYGDVQCVSLFAFMLNYIMKYINYFNIQNLSFFYIINICYIIIISS